MSNAEQSQNIFETLAALIGHWHGVNEEGREVWVDYSFTANDSVIVEHWVFHNKMESLTLFHRDNARLIATHYCPIGNQPTLELQAVGKDGTVRFEKVSVTNLRDRDEDHCHDFEMTFNTDGTFYRTETYCAGEACESNGTLFRRI